LLNPFVTKRVAINRQRPEKKTEEKDMNRNAWTRYLMAAVLVLVVGAVWALAEEIEMKVEVRNQGGQEITVDVNGVKEVIHLDDLAEGEERSFDVGGHPIVVKRVDDQLTLIHEGGEMLEKIHHAGDNKMVWVTEGDTMDVFFVGDGDHEGHRVMIMKTGEGDFETIDIDRDHEGHHVMIMKTGEGDFETIDVDGDHHNTWIAKGEEGNPIIIKEGHHFHGGDFVSYRCEETGSMLMVKKDDAILDSYVDPATGCLMEKVEEAKVKVIVKKKLVETTEDTDE